MLSNTPLPAPGKQRLSKALYAALPAPLTPKLKEWAGHFHFASVTVVFKPAGSRFSAGEGEHWIACAGDRLSDPVAVVTEYNLGSAQVAHDIGAQITPPPGAWLLCVDAGYGPASATLYYIDAATPPVRPWRVPGAVPFSGQSRVLALPTVTPATSGLIPAGRADALLLVRRLCAGADGQLDGQLLTDFLRDLLR